MIRLTGLIAPDHMYDDVCTREGVFTVYLRLSQDSLERQQLIVAYTPNGPVYPAVSCAEVSSGMYEKRIQYSLITVD